MTTTQALVTIGALADPVRRSLYRFISAQDAPVSREAAADAVGITLSKAKFHLDRLVSEGLLETEFRRLSGKQGPGAGRPSKLYRRSHHDIAVSLPERRYDVMGSILAAAVTRSVAGSDLPSAISAAAYQQGAADGERQARAGRGDASRTGQGDPSEAEPNETVPNEAEPVETNSSELGAAGEVLAGLGYEPEVQGDRLVLRNCPFDALASEHRDLVCSTNERYVQGVLDAGVSGNLCASLEPCPGQCCVVARMRGADPAENSGKNSGE